MVHSSDGGCAYDFAVFDGVLGCGESTIQRGECRACDSLKNMIFYIKIKILPTKYSPKSI